MMYIGLYTEPIITHESIINGMEVSCNYLFCTYIERFDSIEDAEIAAEIHEEVTD